MLQKIIIALHNYIFAYYINYYTRLFVENNYYITNTTNYTIDTFGELTLIVLANFYFLNKYVLYITKT